MLHDCRGLTAGCTVIDPCVSVCCMSLAGKSCASVDEPVRGWFNFTATRYELPRVWKRRRVLFAATPCCCLCLGNSVVKRVGEKAEVLHKASAQDARKPSAFLPY